MKWLNLIRERLSDCESKARIQAMEVRELQRDRDEAKRKLRDTERALVAIYTYLGVDWQIPGEPKLVKKGGPECPE